MAVVAAAGFALVFALGARPGVDVLNAVPLQDGYVGTTYAFDGLLCVGSQVTGTRVTGAEVEQSPSARTEVVRPPAGSPPTVGFPAPDEGDPVDGYEVPAGESECELRVLVTPTSKGDARAGLVRLSLAYGPFGLLRRTVEVDPGITLAVDGEGRDPRSG